jgi:subtilisin family serine protease
MKFLTLILILLALPMLLWAALPVLEPGAYYAPGKFIVNLRVGIDPHQENGTVRTGISALDNLNQEYTVTAIEKLFPGSTPGTDAVEISGYYVFHFRGSDQARLEAVLNRYSGLSVVEHVEPVGIHPVFFTPNDPSYTSQWHHNQTNDHDIDSPQAWDVQKGASNAILGIADTGVLWAHADLSSNVWINSAEQNGTAGVDDDGNGYVDDFRGWDWVNVGSGWSGEDLTTPDNDPKDFNGHGTHCAGISAAVMNNSTGVAGIAGGNYPTQGARILALRIGWSGSYLGQEVGYIDMSYAASAFYYATTKGACAINCSWGSSNSGGLGAAVDNAVANGMVVCSAAGNSNNQTASYLCGRTDVVSVAATDQNDLKASFSSYGTWVDVSAPGVSIYSTYSNHYTATYASLSGTSMATPCVVGLAGLLKSQNLTWNRTQIIPQILNTAENIDGLNPSFVGKLGTGRINAALALGGSTPAPSITVAYPNGGETWTVSQTYTITWTSQNLTGNVNVKLNRNYPGGTWETLASNTANDGSQSWTVFGATASANRIRVESYGTPTVYDESNANFTISTGGGGTPVTIFSDNFDGSFNTSRYSRGDSNGSNGSDYWDNKTTRPHAGSRSCYCAGKGTPSHPPYDNYMNAYFYTKSGSAVNVSGYSNVTFNFWIWYETESGYDFVKPQYWSGSAWVDFPSSSWSGSSGGWVQKTYTLTGFTTFRYRFNFTSDYSVTAEGAYVDDIQITGVPTANNSFPGGEIAVVDMNPEALPSVAQGGLKAETIQELGTIPTEYSLEQNTPNPFNPLTTLTYNLPEASVVSLTVFNARGQQVATLAEGLQNAGTHTVDFNGSALAGGLYFAYLRSGEFTAVRKMILLK